MGYPGRSGRETKATGSHSATEMISRLVLRRVKPKHTAATDITTNSGRRRSLGGSAVPASAGVVWPSADLVLRLVAGLVFASVVTESDINALQRLLTKLARD